MREKYESLALADLKAIAKARGIKGVSTMKKSAVVEAMLAQDEKDKAAREAKTAEESMPQAQQRETKRPQKKDMQRPQRREAQRAPQERMSGQQAGSAPQERMSGQQAGSAPQERMSGQQAGSAPQERMSGQQAGSAPQERMSGQQAGSAPQERVSGQQPENAPQERVSGQQPENAPQERMAGQQPESVPQETARPAGSSDRGTAYDSTSYPAELDSGIEANGILEVMPDGYGFIRSANYMPGDNDVYVAPSQIRRFGLKTGDVLVGNKRTKTQQEKFSALLFVKSINGYTVEQAVKRRNFEDMTPIFPNERIQLEMAGSSVSTRIMDLLSPVGKGQRGMIVSPPKAGKTTLLKEVARSILKNSPDMHMLILLIDERPEEVTDMKEAIKGPNVEVIYSTFDELPEHHKRVSEMTIERAKRLVEHDEDVVILLDSITRLTRAYNQVVPPSGRTLSGGLDPAALHMPKRFFGAARNMREGGSLTILATALVDTGSKMDDVVYEEFKGTGNMEIVLDRKLSEKRIFPAVDIQKSSTRREDLLLNREELEAINIIRKSLNGMKSDEAADRILDMFTRTRNNREFVAMVKKMRIV